MPGETLKPDSYDEEPLSCPLEADCRKMTCPGPSIHLTPALIVGGVPVSYDGERHLTCTVLQDWLGGKPLPPEA